MSPIYGTKNGAEALCLYTAGIPLHPDQQAENLYTPDWLNQNGFGSVADAVAAKRHGFRAWFFVTSERQQKLSSAFHAQRKALEAAGNTAPTANLPALSDADYAAMCAFLHANRQFIENMWKSVPPKKAFPDGNGGFKVIGANASEENKRRLGV